MIIKNFSFMIFFECKYFQKYLIETVCLFYLDRLFFFLVFVFLVLEKKSGIKNVQQFTFLKQVLFFPTMLAQFRIRMVYPYTSEVDICFQKCGAKCSCESQKSSVRASLKSPCGVQGQSPWWRPMGEAQGITIMQNTV